MDLQYFSEGEFDCNCCGENHMDAIFLAKLDKARAYSNVPYAITSGYRCPKHNRDVGGEPDGSHPKGLAADIAVDGSRSRFHILFGLIQVGFTRIGIGEDFIHADDDQSKDPRVTWLY